MADPGSIIGLTSSIITFVDFGVKVVRLARSIREANGSAPEVQELDLIAEEIRVLSDGVLRRRSTPARGRSVDEDRMLAMAAECRNLAVELRALLATLTVRGEAWSKTMELGRVMIQTFRKKGDIEGIWKRLNKLDQALRDSVRRSLQELATPLWRDPVSRPPADIILQRTELSHLRRVESPRTTSA